MKRYRSTGQSLDASKHQRYSSQRLERLKKLLLQDSLRGVFDTEVAPRLRRAAEEAASLSWITPYPLLVLPELFVELAAEARLRAQRQREIRARSPRPISW